MAGTSLSWIQSPAADGHGTLGCLIDLFLLSGGLPFHPPLSSWEVGPAPVGLSAYACVPWLPSPLPLGPGSENEQHDENSATSDADWYTCPFFFRNGP